MTLQGDLGAGKTTIARELIRTLANDNTLDVLSPTFTLVQSYQLPGFEIIHADLYRLSMAEEIDELGLHEARGESIILIEWPEKGANLLGPATFSIAVHYENCGRRIVFTSAEHSAEHLHQSLAVRTF